METIIEEDLPMQVDCIQWHPTSEDIMAVGAYQLSPTTTDTRIGRLYVIQLTPNVPGGFTVVVEYETPGGVLDFKFNPFQTPPTTTTPTSPCTIALATSTGLYTLHLHLTPTPSLTPLLTIETPAMVLYLQWISMTTLIFSSADGSINLLDTNEPHLRKRKKIHEALTWICHYSSDQGVLYAGCDDGKFNAFKLEDLAKEEMHFVKRFEVGVTSLASKEDFVVVGGYDDLLKIYTLTSTTPKPNLQLKTSLNLHGAPWRTQILPSFITSGNWTLVVSTARKGVKFIEFDMEKLAVVGEVMKYEGFLAYGLDVRVSGRRFKVASGYFDNNVVHAFYWGVS